jgi:hypothetical protein
MTARCQACGGKPRRRRITASADRDEVDAAPVDARQFGRGDHLGIEDQPEGIVPRDLMPELDEPHQFSRLIGTGQVGVGVAHDPAGLLLGEEAQDAGTGLAAAGQVVVLQCCGIAPERGGVEVQGEGPSLGEQEWGQGRDPAGEEALLLIPLGAIGVLGGISRLGQDVETGEEAQALIAVEVADMAPPLRVQELQGQHAQQGAGGRDHLRAGIARLCDEVIEAESGQQRQEQEDARNGGAQPPSGLELQASSVGHLGHFGLGRRGLGRTSGMRGGEKRGDEPERHRVRNWWITWRVTVHGSGTSDGQSIRAKRAATAAVR